MRETMRLADLIKLVADIGYADSTRGLEKGVSIENRADSAFQHTYHRMRNEGDIYAANGLLSISGRPLMRRTTKLSTVSTSFRRR